MRHRIEDLLERTAQLDLDTSASRRRDDLTERAVAAGHTHEYADLLYDLAEEEGLDPAVAFELVLTGVGVRELAPTLPDHWEETQVGAPPAWIAGEAPPADVATRERLARTSFRRMRSALESSASLAEAARAFVRQPDVGDVEY